MKSSIKTSRNSNKINSSFFHNNLIMKIAGTILSAVLVYLVVLSYFYITTPANVRSPKYEHLHFRAQVLVNGKAEDFSQEKYQDLLPNACSGKVADSPIHFHDHINQIVHIHWRDITGGQVLKNYGWNFVGGTNSSLGRRFDQKFLLPSEVKVHGKLLPELGGSENFFIYTGDENGYTKKNWDDFLNQDLPTFFGAKSNVDYPQSFLDSLLFKKVSAHEGDNQEVKPATSANVTKTNEELTRINNLLGNVVIFAQSSEPTDQQIKDRFSNLVPLQDSTCGG